MKEITENMDLLSETPRGYYYGRFNKWAAHALDVYKRQTFAGQPHAGRGLERKGMFVGISF